MPTPMVSGSLARLRVVFAGAFVAVLVAVLGAAFLVLFALLILATE
jgi:hypothetical protein